MKTSLNLIPILLLIGYVSINFYQSCSPVHDLPDTQVELTSTSVDVFTQTLYPILETNCAACHGSTQEPRFAVDNPETSHNTLMSQQLVSLKDPEESLLIQKILAGHNGFPVSLANQIKDAITQWSIQLDIISPVDANKSTFSYVHNNILVPLCVDCHKPGGQKASVDFSTYETTMASNTVMPGSPSQSSLYVRCSPNLPFGVKAMPPNGGLTTDQLTSLSQWISEGAQNN